MISRLEDLCKTQIAIVLANKLEFKKEILRLPDLDLNYILWHNVTEPWFENMEERVLDTLKKLPFESREKIPTSVVIFCLSQSIEWAKFHKEEFGLPVDYSCHFLTSSFFTSNGIINKEKAAREILKDTEISSSTRFCLACYYCLSDAIPALWEQLPEDTRFKINNGCYESVLGIGGNNKMVELWSYFLLGKHQTIMEEGETFSLYKFKKSLERYSNLSSNYVGTDSSNIFFSMEPCLETYESYKNCKDVPFKNCFEELDELEINNALIFSRDELLYILNYTETFNNRDMESDQTPILFPLQLNLPFQPFVEMVKYLLSRLNEEQLRLFFQPDVLYFVLFHLLNWPYQNLFMVTVNRFLDILSKNGFCLLLERIVSLMKNKVSGKLRNYHKLFRDFWMTCPSSHKRYFFRFECIINKKDIYDTLDSEERRDYYDCCCDSELDIRFVICDLFRSSFTIEDQKIVRLIFESATLEEKSAFVRMKGNTIGKIAFDACDLSRIDFFIELCIPNEKIISFKKGLFNDNDVVEILYNLVIDYNKLEEVQNILNWALCAEEIKEWQQTNFLIYLKENYFYYNTSNDLKCIDTFLEWSLSSDEIKDFKESLISKVDIKIKRNYMNLLKFKGDLQKYDYILEWIFSSENKIAKFKIGLALEMVDDVDCSYISNGLSLLKKFVNWSALSEEVCKDFKRQCAFREEMVESYSKFVAQSELHQIDEFIHWAELTETETKEFKKLLVEKRNVISACVSDIVNDKPGFFIKEMFNWIQFSEEEVKEFYSLLPEELSLYININEKKTKLSLKNFFSGFPLSENEIKRHKKNILSKNFDIIEYFVMENKWDEVEELLSWGLTSEMKLCITVCLNLILILRERFDDVDKFCNLIGIYSSSKKTILNKIIFDSRIYQIVSGFFVLLRDDRIEGVLNFLSSHDILSTKWKECFLNWYYETKKQRECYHPKCCRIFRWHDYYEYKKHSDYDVLCGLCKKFVADSKRFSELVNKRINKSVVQQKRKLEPSHNNNTNETKRGRHC